MVEKNCSGICDATTNVRLIELFIALSVGIIRDDDISHSPQILETSKFHLLESFLLTSSKSSLTYVGILTREHQIIKDLKRSRL